MNEPSYLGSFMGRLSSTEEFTPPITRDQAKAQGLKVFQSKYYCRRSSKHGALRLTSSNKCAKCAELERSIEKDLRAKVMDKLMDEATRLVLKQSRAILANARKEAEDIIKAAQREAMDSAKMLEKAKATREANKAQAAASRAEVVTQPKGPEGIEAPPWDEPPRSGTQEAPQVAPQSDDMSDQGGGRARQMRRA